MPLRHPICPTGSLPLQPVDLSYLTHCTYYTNLVLHFKHGAAEILFPVSSRNTSTCTHWQNPFPEVRLGIWVPWCSSGWEFWLLSASPKKPGLAPFPKVRGKEGFSGAGPSFGPKHQGALSCMPGALDQHQGRQACRCQAGPRLLSCSDGCPLAW